MYKHLIFFSVALCLTNTTPTQAADIFNTIASQNTTSLITGGASRAIFGSYFQLGNATATVNSLTVPLRGTIEGLPIPWLASIFSSSTSSTTPSTWVADFPVTNATTSTLANVTFTLATPVNLTANRRYWFLLTNTSNGLQGQIGRSTTPADSIANPSISFSNNYYSLNYSNTTGLTTMSNITITGGSLSTTSSLVFSVDGTVVPIPEPSTYALAAIASGVLACLARRHIAQKA